jgi:hypothetical protein
MTKIIPFLFVFGSFAMADVVIPTPTPAPTPAPAPTLISYADFKTLISEDMASVQTGSGCSTEVKEVRNTLTLSIRKNGRIAKIDFTDRDRIMLNVQGEEPIERTYQDDGQRSFIKFTHSKDTFDRVAINLGGRETVCEKPF